MRLFFLSVLCLALLPSFALADTDFIGKNKGDKVRRIDQITNDLLSKQNKLMYEQNDRLQSISEALNEQATALKMLGQNQQQIAVMMQTMSRQLVTLNDQPGIEGNSGQVMNEYQAGAQALQANKQNEALLRVLSQISEQQRLQSVLLESLLNQATGQPIVINE